MKLSWDLREIENTIHCLHHSSLYLKSTQRKPYSQAPADESDSVAAKQKLSAAQKIAKTRILPTLGARHMQEAAEAWCYVRSSSNYTG